MLKYLSQVEELSYEFIKLLAEALGLESDALADFFDQPGNLQHRSKVSISLEPLRQTGINIIAPFISPSNYLTSPIPIDR